MKKLTEREERVLMFIELYILENSVSPTRQEIADKFNFYPSGAQYYVEVLETKERLIRVNKKRHDGRNIEIIS